MVSPILFWHRRDLRLDDNVGLMAARRVGAKVVGVFCLDPSILQREDVAPARVAYMIESLRELQSLYDRAGSQLLVLQADPREAILKLALALTVKQVYWNQDVEPYSIQRDRHISEALAEQGIEAHLHWDQLMHGPGEVKTGAGKPYTVYTPFWKNWIQHPKSLPIGPIQGLEGLTDVEQDAAIAAGSGPLPTASSLGFEWNEPFVLDPGVEAAQAALNDFCRDRGPIYDYGEKRNIPSHPGTSRLSAALKFGTIGIRTVWERACQTLEYSRSDETTAHIQTWQQELAWREFYQHALYFFPELADGPYRDTFKNFPWSDRRDYFEAWCQGQTGYPIVDAAMRQLNQTGWMHNRCRMIVASFLTKDLIIDWRWGEQYFMQTLIDGDLAANNGGWQWSASSGMDPKPLRIFNPASQAKKFDPDADYIRQWLPELRRVETKALVMGTISPAERDRCHYPMPIVDHKHQQQYFKELYKTQKATQ